MSHRSVLVVLSFGLLLASCGNQAVPNGTLYPAFTKGISVPKVLSQAEPIPTALSDLVSLSKTGTFHQQNISSITSIDVVNPSGIVVVRLEVAGPASLDLFSGQAFDNTFSYSLVGANAVQDQVYAYGQGQYLSDRLSKTIAALGGKNQIQTVLTANNMDLIFQTKSGKYYLLGEDHPMTPAEMDASAREYAEIVKGYQDHPGNYQLNIDLWKTIAAQHGQTANLQNQSLKVIAATNLAGLTLPSGALDLQKVVNVTKNAGLDAQQLKAQLLTAQTDHNVITYGSTMPGGGFAQQSYYWAADPHAAPQTWTTYAWVGSGVQGTGQMNIIGCSASAAQALIHDIFRKGYSINGQNWTSQSGTNIFSQTANTDSLYNLTPSVEPNPGNPTYAVSVFPNSFPEYAILNQSTSDGRNFSTWAMNAGYYYNSVVNTVFDIPLGLNRMLNKVWPNSYPINSGQNYVWYEAKSAGAGSNGTTISILQNQLPIGRAVMVSYPLGGTNGHTSIAYQADVTTYSTWYGATTHDAWTKSMDHPLEFRNLTGYNVAASGAFTVNY